jgi:peptide/nickel transport system permease protein
LSPENLKTLRESLGLNDPFLVRYLKWLGGILRGDFGYSLSSGVAIKISCLIAYRRRLNYQSLRCSFDPFRSILGICQRLAQMAGLSDNILTVLGMVGFDSAVFLGLVAILVFALTFEMAAVEGVDARLRDLWGSSAASNSALAGAGGDDDGRRDALRSFQHVGCVK